MMKSLAKELAKELTTKIAFGELSSQLLKLAVEAALGAEMEAHLGYAKHEKSPHAALPVRPHMPPLHGIHWLLVHQTPPSSRPITAKPRGA